VGIDLPQIARTDSGESPVSARRRKGQNQIMKAKPVSQWTLEERMAWGLKEDSLRQSELALVTDESSLRMAQANALKRRNAVRASPGQAFQMIVEAQRERARLEKTQ
jgi:hypothetical protein